jgi:6,7-dimethyl-8-ribityllumazine synthase
VSLRIEGQLSAGGAKFAIVVSRFNAFITGRLLDGARDVLRRHGAGEDAICEVWVPGACELPLAAKGLIESGRFDAVICLGAVIRGDTTHHEHVGSMAARGIAEVALSTGVPVAFGVLTCDTIDQAVSRAGSKGGNKGADAAMSALEMVSVMAQLRALGRKKA